MEMRRLALLHTRNTRDLGGYPTKDGGCTAFRALFRSDFCDGACAEDERALREMGITTFIDLRTEDEAQRLPFAYAHARDFRYHLCPLCDKGVLPPAQEDIDALYCEMMGNAPAVAEIVRILARARGAAMFFCAAGKDRTGVVAALCLGLAGVADADILADYLTSNAYLHESILDWEARHADFPRGVVAANIRYMRAALAFIRERYASMEGYMLRAGVLPEDIRSFREKVLSR